MDEKCFNPASFVAGVADMAGKLYEPLKESVAEAEALSRPITFGGHSLGGSLAILLAVLFRLQHGLPPELVKICNFGSPPVLSHGEGRGGDAILEVGCFLLSKALNMRCTSFLTLLPWLVCASPSRLPPSSWMVV